VISKKERETSSFLLCGFDCNHILSLLVEHQIFARGARRQFLQAARRCFEITRHPEPNQAAGAIPFKKVESGYRHGVTHFGI
jgi:hypothetical protein